MDVWSSLDGRTWNLIARLPDYTNGAIASEGDLLVAVATTRGEGTDQDGDPIDDATILTSEEVGPGPGAQPSLTRATAHPPLVQTAS